MHLRPSVNVPNWFWLPALLLVGLRFLHMGPELDDPHLWRQSDTANYIRDFYLNGVDLLHPSVCWMGGHKTVIFEFPLPEAIAAWVHKLLGPALIWSRLLFLAIYLGAAAYFFKIVRHVTDSTLAAVATLVYLVLPLGLYYSRAIHIDFSAVLCAHAMTYYVLKAVDRESLGYFGLAMVFATLGFMIKVPYVFFLALPLAVYIHREGKWRWFLKASPLLLLPIISFVVWQWHTQRVNAAMPDWSFIPDYHKLDKMGGWYFGTWEDRLHMPNWQLLWGRLKYELAAYIGIPLLGIGAFLGLRNTGIGFMRLWAVGSLVYLIVFFPLNFHHDYYQIPFLAPVAFFMALPLWALWKWLSGRNTVVAGLVLTLCLSILSVHVVRITEGRSLNKGEQEYFGNYFKRDELTQKAGAIILEHTPQNALVISTFGGLDSRCPNLLNAAQRNGWQINKEWLSVNLLKRLQAEGATHFALLQVDPMDPDLEAFVAGFKMKRFVLPDTHWPLRIFTL